MTADLLTVAEAAALLGIPESTLRYWRHCNTGPRSFAVGRSVRYRAEDVEAWLEARMAATSRGGTGAEATTGRPSSPRDVRVAERNRRAARIYASAEGPRLAAVADEFNVSRATAARYVRAAREAGLIAESWAS